MYTVEIWMKGNEVEEDERDFQIKTSEVLPKVSSRPWVGGGAIDYCPCYGQIAFYSLITFSYQPQQGLHTQATNTLSHKHTVKSLGDSYLEKIVQRHEAQLDIAGRYTGCFLFPPPPQNF